MGKWCNAEPLFSSDASLRFALHLCDVVQSDGCEPGFHNWPEEVKRYSHLLLDGRKYAAHRPEGVNFETQLGMIAVTMEEGMRVCQATGDTYVAVYDVIEGVSALEWATRFPILVMFLNQRGADDEKFGRLTKHVWEVGTVAGSEEERCSWEGYQVLAMLIMR